MPIFRYKGFNAMGQRIKGAIDADSLLLAKDKLRAERLIISHLILVSALKKSPSLRPGTLLDFTREMNQLLGAGLPLYESLLTIEEKYRKHRSHFLFLDLCDRLKSGYLLSTILRSYPRSFDPIYISLVEAGEKTGALSWAFAQLHDLVGRRQKLKKQLLSAMAYPIFLAIFCFLVVAGLLLFVIPSMQELFEGRQLHPLTQVIVSLSRWLERFLIPLVGGITGGIVLSIAYFKRPGKKRFLQKICQKLPLIKTVWIEAALIRFSRSTSILLFGGVPLLSALKVACQATNHPLVEEVILQAEKGINEGHPLSRYLFASPHIPPLVGRMVSIAEETGKLPDMLKSLSEIYDLELERSLAQITTFLQPALLVILGGIVGLVILSILLPLTDVSSLISN